MSSPVWYKGRYISEYRYYEIKREEEQRRKERLPSNPTDDPKEAMAYFFMAFREIADDFEQFAAGLDGKDGKEVDKAITLMKAGFKFLKKRLSKLKVARGDKDELSTGEQPRVIM